MSAASAHVSDSNGEPARIGVLGGTFDPPHYGHLRLGVQAHEQLHLDRVLFVPAGTPWQKDAGITSAADRLAMTRLACRDNPLFDISTVDVDREGPTYAVDTLRDIRQHYPDATIFFLVGADAFAGIHTWRDAETLPRLAHLVVANRPGYVPVSSALSADSIAIMDVPISSQDCRNRVAQGLSIRYLTPDAVVDFIARKGLYRS